MLCPECGQGTLILKVTFHIPLEDDGKLRSTVEGTAVTEEPDDEEVVCDVCLYTPAFDRDGEKVKLMGGQRPGDMAERWRA